MAATRRRRDWLLPLLSLALLSACFNPEFNEGKRCDPDDACPPGFRCNAEKICVGRNTDAGSSADGPADANKADGPFGGAIVLFAGPLLQGHLGIGGRDAIDDICETAATFVVPCQDPSIQIGSFISVNEEDPLAFMPELHGVPSKLPITSPSGTVIAPKWAAIAETNQLPLQSSLSAAGVLPADSAWWTGSTAQGEGAAENCADWTVNTGSSGAVGSGDKTDGSWLATGIATCNSQLPILCICYPPAPQ